MAIASVIITFLMCILFNIFLPTGDVGSDLNLIYQTLTFNLGDSIELSGCKSCYHKSENDVYYPQKVFPRNECKTCLYNKNHGCGVSNPTLIKRIELESEKDTCLNNGTFRLTNEGRMEVGECDEDNDDCCITKSQDMNKRNQIQTLDQLDPKKAFNPCVSIHSELHLCFVSGKASGINCASFIIDKEFLYRSQDFQNEVLSSSSNKSIFFYPYSRINQSWVVEEESRSISDPDVECGLLYLRQNRNDTNQEKFKIPDGHYCN